MSQVRIILQARLSSSRLPAKCLLPVGGYPLGVLSALRAGNSGIPVVLATSSEKEDDALVATAEKHGVDCVRGPLEDVFTRFSLATEDLSDDAWVVRLTADNCFPDGEFIAALVQQAEEQGTEYLGTASPTDGLPYGLSAEVFKISAMRSVSENLSAFDKEHVTPVIKRRYGAKMAVFNDIHSPQLRCTVDTKTDYFRMLELFANVSDPVGVSFKVLCHQLAGQAGEPKFRIPWSEHSQGIIGKITLGTAQLGLPAYGRVNKSGKPSDEQAFRLLDKALRHGVTHIDTAQAYGDAESRLASLSARGLYAEPTVITKLDPLEGLGEGASVTEVAKWVEASVYRSSHALRKQVLPVLMLHRWAHYRGHGGQIWDTLKRLKDEGVVARLGASVYSPEEAVEALAEPLITDLQIPFNLLDHRWRAGAFEAARAARPDAVVYCRSAYLQGLLVSDAKHWPTRKGLDVGEWVDRIETLTKELKRKSRADLCIAYLMASPLIDSIVMGVEALPQLEENLELACRPPLSQEEVRLVEKAFNDAPAWLLDPSQW